MGLLLGNLGPQLADLLLNVTNSAHERRRVLRFGCHLIQQAFQVGNLLSDGRGDKFFFGCDHRYSKRRWGIQKVKQLPCPRSEESSTSPP